MINIDNIQKITCSKCGAINNIRFEKLGYSINCGKCKENISDTIKKNFNFEKENIFQLIDKLDNIFINDLNEYFRINYDEEFSLNFYKKISDLKDKKNKLESNDLPLLIVIAGEFSSGKSSVINSLIGESLIPTGSEPMTLAPSIFKYSEELKITLEFNDNTYKDISQEEFTQIKHINKKLPEEYKNIKFIHFHYPYPKLAQINIIDTPGFSTSTETGDDKKTEDIIMNRSDVIIWVFNANHGTSKKSETSFLTKIFNFFNSGKKNYSSNFSENKNIKSSNNVIGLLNQVDIKGEPDSKDVQRIIEEIRKETSLEKIIPYSAEKILEYKKINFKEKILKIIENKLFNENKDNCQILVETKTDKFSNKRIIISNNNTNIFDDEFDLDDVWVKPLNELESELNYIRERSKYIIFSSLSKELFKIKEEINSKIDDIIEKIKTRNNKYVDVFKSAKKESNEVKSKIKKKYENYNNEFKSKLKSFLPDLIFDIIEEKGIFYDSKKIEVKSNIFDNKKYIFDKVYGSFSFEKAKQKELDIIDDIFNKINSNLNFNQEINNQINENIKDMKDIFNENSINSFDYIVVSILDLGVHTLSTVSSKISEEYNQQFDSNISDSYHKNVLFDKIYEASGLSFIFHYLNILIEKCYEKLIESFDSEIEFDKEESDSEIKYLKEIKELLYNEVR